VKNKKQTDTSIILNLLEQAAEHSAGGDVNKIRSVEYPSREFGILHNLITAGMIEGSVLQHRAVAISGITLQGRLYRDELVQKREAKRWPSRRKRIGLVAAGWLGGLLTTYAKVIIEHLFK
jgi:hypothetical protein